MTGGRCSRCAGVDGVHPIELRSDGLAVVVSRLCARCDAEAREILRRALSSQHASA